MKGKLSTVPPSIPHVAEMGHWFTGVGVRSLTVALMGHLLKYGVTAEKLFPYTDLQDSAGVLCYRYGRCDSLHIK